MKKFIDERKRYAMRHSRQAEALKKSHAEQSEKLVKENEKVMPKKPQLLWNQFLTFELKISSLST